MNGADVLLAIALLLATGEGIAIGLLFFLRNFDRDVVAERHGAINRRLNPLWDDYVERVKGVKYIDPALMRPITDQPDEILAESAPLGEDWSQMPSQVGAWSVKE